MRWRFPDPGDHEETAARNAILARMDAWWKAFASRTGDLDDYFSSRSRWDLPGWMQEHLQAVDPRLMWEYGPGLKGGHRLVITPESDHFLRPMVETLLSRAPTFERWEFYAHRLPEEVSQIPNNVRGRTGGDPTGCRIEVKEGEHHRIDLTFHLQGCTGPDDTQAASVAFVTAETALGEETIDRWIGVIEAVPLKRRGLLGGLLGKPGGVPGTVELKDLRSEVERIRAGILNRLRPEPIHRNWSRECEDTPWTLFKSSPAKRTDYPGWSDLFVAPTSFEAMWKAAHAGSSFHSCRFSRAGETFCYLKIDGAEGLDPERFGDRGEIDNALDARLVPAGAGCVIGGGTGYRYSYCDLALTDVAKAVGLIREVLQKGNIPKRTWILFFDDDLEDEWIPVWEDAPPPPREERES